MLANECVRRSEADVRAGLLKIWSVMTECVDRGCATAGVLPGGLKVRRRAADMFQRLVDESASRNEVDPLAAMDWVTLWALAVNEENASGGRVVTAPTNGAAGIIPAVLHYAVTFVPGTDDDAHRQLPAGRRGTRGDLPANCVDLRRRGRLPGRGRYGMLDGSGCACRDPRRHAGAGRERGRDRHGTPPRASPAILWVGSSRFLASRRNAVGSVQGDHRGPACTPWRRRHTVSLDKVIKTMMQTGADMKIKYKETARGGLAVNIVEC